MNNRKIFVPVPFTKDNLPPAKKDTVFVHKRGHLVTGGLFHDHSRMITSISDWSLDEALEMFTHWLEEQVAPDPVSGFIYHLSTNYEKLYVVVKSMHTVFAVIGEDHNVWAFRSQKWNMVSAFTYDREKEQSVTIRSESVIYFDSFLSKDDNEHADEKKDFIAACEKYNLKWIMPHEHVNAVWYKGLDKVIHNQLNVDKS